MDANATPQVTREEVNLDKDAWDRHNDRCSLPSRLYTSSGIDANCEEGEEYRQCQVFYSKKFKLSENSHVRAAHLSMRGHQCNICQKGFLSGDQLARHVTAVHKDCRPYKSNLCVIRQPEFVSQWLPVHMNFYEKSEPAVAQGEVCQMKIANTSRIVGDKKLHEGLVSLECGVCKKEFCQCGHMVAYQGATSDSNHCNWQWCHHDMTEKYQCDICGQTFSRKDSLHRHKMRVHRPDGSLCLGKRKATEPSRVCTTTEEIVEHCESANSNTSVQTMTSETSEHVRASSPGSKFHQCDICKKVFTAKSSVMRHLASVHAGCSPHQCYFCDARYTRPSDLVAHISSVHGSIEEKPEEPLAQCGVCQKKFSRIWDLLKHGKTHDDLKPHECGVCKKRFNRADVLLAHVKGVHGKVKQTQCEEHSKILEGKVDHDVMPKNQCNLCGKTFTRKDHVLRHQRTVHKSLGSECKSKKGVTKKSKVDTVAEAGIKYDESKNTRNLESKVDHDVRLLNECSDCGKTFTRRDHMLRHQRTIHNSLGSDYKSKKDVTGRSEVERVALAGLKCDESENTQLLKFQNKTTVEETLPSSAQSVTNLHSTNAHSVSSANQDASIHRNSHSHESMLETIWLYHAQHALQTHGAYNSSRPHETVVDRKPWFVTQTGNTRNEFCSTNEAAMKEKIEDQSNLPCRRTLNHCHDSQDSCHELIATAKVTEEPSAMVIMQPESKGAQGSIEADGFPKEDYSIWWNECNHPSDHTKQMRRLIGTPLL